MAWRLHHSKPWRSAGGKSYATGWRNVSYPGLLPYNQYKPAELKTRKVDVKVAPGLSVGYVMGTGDTVPEAIEELGVTPHLLTGDELRIGRSLAVERDRDRHSRLLHAAGTGHGRAAA